MGLVALSRPQVFLDATAPSSDNDLHGRKRRGTSHVRSNRTLGGMGTAGPQPCCADSDEVAQAFRNDVARCYEMMPPSVPP
jgi:hypothetical protein